MPKLRSRAWAASKAAYSQFRGGTTAPSVGTPPPQPVDPSWDQLQEMLTGRSRGEAQEQAEALRQADTWMVKTAHKVGHSLGAIKKALAAVDPKPVSEFEGQAIDDEAFYSNPKEFRERPSGLSNDTLRAMSYKVPIISAIHQTRLNQVGIFGRPRTEPTEMGFIILPKSQKEQRSPTRATFRRIEQFSDFFAHCGSKWGDRHLLRPNLEGLLRMCVRDSLTFDQYAIQMNFNRKGQPAEFVAMAGHSMRLASRDGDTGWNFDPDDVHYTQVKRRLKIADFTARELIWGVRNPRSDLEVAGYGMSELELLIQVVTGMLWAEAHNARFFSAGSTVKGLLNIKGMINRKQLRAFRREWFALLRGVQNSWRTPVLNADEVQFIPMHASNRDMEFTEWLYYLLKVATAVYQIDPSEVNFTFGNEGQAVQVFESNNEAKTRLSRDRGLRPLVVNIQQSLQRVMDALDPNFMIILAGLDSKTEEQKASLAETLTRSVWTIDEAREKLYQMPPLPHSGDIVRNGEYMAWLNQLSQLSSDIQLAEDTAQASAAETTAPTSVPAPTAGAKPAAKKKPEVSPDDVTPTNFKAPSSGS